MVMWLPVQFFRFGLRVKGLSVKLQRAEGNPEPS